MNFGSFRDWTHQAAGIAHIFHTNENVDMLPNLPLLGREAIPQAWVDRPQSGQCLGQRRGRLREDHLAARSRKFAQGPRNVKRYGHGYLVPRRDLRVQEDFVSEELTGDAMAAADLGPEETSSINALRTQTMLGRPSKIFCQLFPSSLDAKSCPLRVPK